MDGSSDWEASALFSPSKARAQQVQSKDWAVVDAWLARKYGATKRLPSFERNEETLQTLLTLASTNDAADEQHALIESVQKAAIQGWAKFSLQDEATGSPHNVIFRGMDVDGQASLQTLSETAILTGTSDPITMASRICDMTTEHFEAREQLNRALAQLQALESERSRVLGQLDELKEIEMSIDPSLGEQTITWLRDTKHLRAKISEYDDQLRVTSTDPGPRTRVEDVTKAMSDLNAERNRLQALQSQLATFEVLTTDPKNANKKLRAAKDQLRATIMQRDDLMEQMMRQ